MNFLWAALIVVGTTSLAIAVMLFVRRRAPEGSYFEDGDRASGVFGVIATGFAVLLGFVVFLAFESLDASRSGAETEARVVAHQFETAQLLPPAVGARLSGELVCYARNVARDEWEQLEAGGKAAAINPWTVAMFHSIRAGEPRSASEQAAYSKWLDQTSDREDARADRTHGAEGVIPPYLWIVLFLTAAVIFGYMLFFADRAERKKVQAMLIGGVAVVSRPRFCSCGSSTTPTTVASARSTLWRWSVRSDCSSRRPTWPAMTSRSRATSRAPRGE